MKTFGLRGGYQPWNSLESFKKAKDEKLDGVTADIWMTRDEKLAVLHGTQEGDMILEDKDNSYHNYGKIYMLDWDELKSMKKTACLLEDVLKIFQDD